MSMDVTITITVRLSVLQTRQSNAISLFYYELVEDFRDKRNYNCIGEVAWEVKHFCLLLINGSKQKKEKKIMKNVL